MAKKRNDKWDFLRERTEKTSQKLEGGGVDWNMFSFPWEGIYKIRLCL